ncbi:efflux RND transporter periplasmic adaptor subunit [candidate division KSB1 bacterium]|nr:efflux RND transporter periplasmic adaptor subunit [candidate division KSB1 bacterium]
MTTKRGDVALKLRGAIALLSLIGTGLALFGCSGESGGSQENEANKLLSAVEAVQARHGTLPLTERLSGVVKAKNQVEIYPELSAAIVEVHVENGDVVKRGQPLIRLRDNEFRERLKQARAGYQIAVAQAKQAEAQLKEVQAELKRTEALAEKELVSATELETVRTRTISAEADFELAEARVEQAQATVDEREVTLSQTVIRAPIAGTVGNRNAEVGMLVSNGTRLFTLGQLDNVRVQVVLTDRMLNYIETGQRTEIYTENAPSGSMIAALTRISPFLHPVAHSTDAEIDLANPEGSLKSGMFVAVDIYYGESEQATLVPLSALYENPATGATGIYVSQDSLDGESVGAMTDGQAASLTAPVSFKFVPVEVIAKGRMEAGVRGVEPGSWVVTIGKDLLGGETGTARVRPVNWRWVEQLQHLQRDDLLQEVLKRQQGAAGDSAIQREAE